MLPNRVNGRITASELQLIDEHGAELGIFSRTAALDLARARRQDLIEVEPGSSPPVCLVTDFGKYRHQLLQRRADAERLP